MGEFGITAAHAQVSDTCRSERGDDGAFVEAVEVIRRAYREAVEGRAGQKGVKYHIVLYVEPPPK